MVDQMVKNCLTTTATNATATGVTFGDIKFVVNDGTVVNATTFAVDANGVLTFTAGNTAGTAVITAYNSKTGASATTTVKVEAGPTIKTFQISNPGKLIVAGEKNVFPVISTDTFGAPIATKDVPAAVAALKAINVNNFNITSTNPNVTVAVNWKATGEAELVFTGTGTTSVYVWVNGAIASQVNVDVKAAATPVKVTGIKDLKTTLTAGGTQTIDFSKVNVIDNYGRTMTTLTGGTLVFTEAANQAAGLGVVDLTEASGLVTGNANTGTEKVTVGIDKDADGVADTGTTFDITFTVVANDKVTAFALDALNSVFVSGTKSVVVSGKTADGTAVALDQTAFANYFTSSDTTVATVSATGVVTGVAKGTATIAAWNSGTKLAETTVTVSDVAPAATSVKFTQAEAAITGVATTVDVSTLLEVKDQYGNVIAGGGKYYSSNTAVASVNVTTGVVTEANATVDGQTTITYVSANGVAATILVSVDN